MGSVKDNIIVTPLKQIEVKGGDVWHAFKRSDPQFREYGEAYFSWVEEGAVKAWKKHKRMTLNLVVPVGTVRFVMMTGQNEFVTEDIGEARYARLTVPPGLWFGFQGLGPGKSLVLNIADIEHDPDEVERSSVNDINYNW
ncbi:dTDP-4-dehydrorhamnose 3,5-epimerase [Sediminibacterium roseum]|uniref:dTDP-4-dehydrorhamnose 3,5-epimerase n=1 Tax=Sediminibacterium roseum TaxID=1978412 RepID=A0ABW9ZPS2_9BACT|nr:dTDP-4-dehydrorhamnose 3,5-epimerase [Sediminibacterium roseum]NCI49094.1 dTDP-4-dehydrorhamnose 3,5-epimerase [Sediminibacterium roseum]